MKDRRTMRVRFPVLKPVDDRKIYRFVEGTEKRPRQQNLDRIELLHTRAAFVSRQQNIMSFS